MVKEVFLTEKGLQEKKDELEYLRTVTRNEVADKIRVARGFGDLSENAEYDQAKLEQAQVEERIAKLEDMIRNVKIIDEDNVDTTRIGLGSRVSLKDLDEDEIVEYIIVGTAETDPMNGKISNESPVGKSLIGKKKGNKVEVHIAGGVIHYQIMKIAK